jgi:hypothetical protein
MWPGRHRYLCRVICRRPHRSRGARRLQSVLCRPHLRSHRGNSARTCECSLNEGNQKDQTKPCEWSSLSIYTILGSPKGAKEKEKSFRKRSQARLSLPFGDNRAIHAAHLVAQSRVGWCCCLLNSPQLGFFLHLLLRNPRLGRETHSPSCL